LPGVVGTDEKEPDGVRTDEKEPDGVRDDVDDNCVLYNR